MQKINLLTLLLYITSVTNILAQQNSTDTLPKKTSFKHNLYGSINTGFYYSLKDNIAPRQAFELSSAIIGYKAEINEKLKTSLLYDVSQTTRDIKVYDSTFKQMEVSYSKGSDYTAFLKQAQIEWAFTKNLELSIGQLLTQQYLTCQDKFWGFRHIVYTFQERYKFGAQSDFGARLTFNKNEKLKVSCGTVNGDGPFSRQDTKGIMLYNATTEFYPMPELIVKFYFDITPDNNLPARMVYSSFIGFKKDKWRIGLEYNQITHQDFVADKTYNGLSVFGSFAINEKLEVLARYDYIENSLYYKKSDYSIAGIQYQPIKNFLISINGRYLSPADEAQIYVNCGIKF